MALKSISYEFKHPTSDKSAYISHDKYGNGDEEFLSIVPGERSNVHSTFEKAEKRLALHEFHNHEAPVNESTEITVRAMNDRINESVVSSNDLHTRYQSALISEHSYSKEEAIVKQRKSLFESVYGANAVFPSVHLALSFFESENASKIAGIKGNLTENADFIRLAKSFKTNSLNESISTTKYMISEVAAPGMEDWVVANKDRFIKKYGKKKGESILYATAWKIHDKKLEESRMLKFEAATLIEMVMDAVSHPEHGRIEWRNEGGAHVISTLNKKTGSKNIHAIGTHQEIAKKWAMVKDRLLKEEWEQADSLALIESTVAATYGE